MAECDWDVAEGRFLSAVGNSDVKAIIKLEVDKHQNRLPGKLDRGDFRQVALWSLFETCIELDLREHGIKRFGSYLRKSIERNFRDALINPFRTLKRDISLEALSIDSFDDDETTDTVAVDRVSIEELVVNRDFSMKLVQCVQAHGNQTMISVLHSLLLDSPWEGDRRRFADSRQRIIDLGRTLLKSVRPDEHTNNQIS